MSGIVGIVINHSVHIAAAIHIIGIFAVHLLESLVDGLLVACPVARIVDSKVLDIVAFVVAYHQVARCFRSLPQILDEGYHGVKGRVGRTVYGFLDCGNLAV